MGIFESVVDSLKDAMKARDRARTLALRNIRAAFLQASKEDGSDTLADERCVALLRTLAKQRRESIEAYAAGGRAELADAERAELAVIEAMLPQLADEDTTRAWVADAIASTGASSRGDLGRVMGAVMKAHRGAIDGKLANRLAAELLA